MPAQGPVISINLNNAEMLLKLGDLKKAAKAAADEIKTVEKAALKAEQQGLKLDASMRERLKRAEKVLDSAKGQMKTADDAESKNTGGTSYGFRKWQSQFQDHGTGVGKHAGMLMNPSAQGMMSAGLQAAGIAGIAAKVAEEMIHIPQTMERIQSRIRDMEREEKGTLTYMSPLEKLRRQQKVERETVDDIPVLGGILGRGNRFGTHMRQLLYGEENEDQVDLRIKNEEAIRRLGLGGSMETARRTNAQKVSQFSRAYANLVGGLDPAQVELQKNIESADALLKEGLKQAARGNLVGDTARKGFGGAIDLFNRSNQLLPGIAPQNAAGTYQELERARIADRNFARSQMTRAGPRTGD